MGVFLHAESVGAHGEAAECAVIAVWNVFGHQHIKVVSNAIFFFFFVSEPF
jgi:hypothetical protein